ncbi:fumarylacetoacetate hydrolase family protein [Alteromonas lipolytica]|uniref:2-keto-4-pentenoate hydratase n=1 Tax=Alteromonas lipolytica TaxID=1856405 RepID=A0A1E8FIY6_9ALTE|nr:fumarylacetoacetate hydrolase family protein [Alteromonas lipolytica]OFI35901.1 2-keto-4-pentenoate hydratase [Alteromonas lipolytica]GGF72751.1 2-keto-4-pentenoate hydratase [Alteromonas lipolytica]
MKLATYKNTTRDGRLMLVSRDLKLTCPAAPVAGTMQELLDNWDELAPALQQRYQALCSGDLMGEKFNPLKCHSPLPRAYHWADGSAYVNHVELVRRARGAEVPESFWHDPLMYQGGSDDFIGPYDDIEAPDETLGIDFEAEVAVVTADVPMGTTTTQAAEQIRLVMLVNDVSLRGLIPGELAKGFGFYQSKPASSFAPVAVTPDELGGSWSDAKVHLPLFTHFNNELFGKPEAGVDMTFNFAQLIAHAARTRNLSAGTIIGSGTVSNKQGTEHGSAIVHGGVGYSCIAEVRMIETIRDGQPATAFMHDGDRVRIEMLDADGASIFGAIDQRVKIKK